MGAFRFVLALFIAKLVALPGRLLSGDGFTLSGKIALAICPDFLERIEKPRRVVAITGTNGKSTVAELMSDCLEAMEIHVLCNCNGKNDVKGIVSTLIRGTGITGKPRFDTAIIEINGIDNKVVLPALRPSVLLVTELSRDSIMENCHPEYMQQLLTHYIPEGTKLVLNGDDLMSVGVAPYNPRKYFGIGPMPGDRKFNANLIDDNPFCPNCHERLSYEYNRYSNMGRAFCPECGFKAPEYDYTAELIIDEGRDVSRKPGKYIKVSTDKRYETFPLLHDSVFNIYNEVAAICTLLELSVRLVDIKNAMSRISIRQENYTVYEGGSKKVIGMLCKEKNGYAASRAFEYIVSQPGNKEILLLNNSINDTIHGSENTCWIYDCDFETLKDVTVKRIVVYGGRAYDYKLRMLVAGIHDMKIVQVDDINEAPEALEYFDNDNIFVLYGSDSVREGKKIIDRIAARIGAKSKGEEAKK